MSLLSHQVESVRTAQPLRIVGRVEAVAGLTIEAVDLPLPLGALCRIRSLGANRCLAEVIGFDADRTLLMPLESASGVARGDAVENVGVAPRIRCSDGLLGRVIDGFGRPIDGLGPLPPGASRRIDGRSVPPLERVNIRQPIATGIRAIDALHTCGFGQRMGVFSGPGVGKSTLISSIARFTSADVSVVALVGERAREVQEFLENTLDARSRQRCVVVVSTGDDVPLLKVRAAKVACTVAEHFRDSGRNVLLMMDSLTRLAQAQRQIGLAAREPPATRGFPPSVFALLPEILERAGRTAAGSITGFYTVLVEGDDFNEPIPDAVKGISDGHLWLSRSLANKGHYPAIDVLQSISRVRGDVGTPPQVAAARRVLALLASFAEIEDLVNIGAYVRGTSVEYDLAVEWRPKVVEFLRQDAGESCPLEESWRRLVELASAIDAAEKQRRSAST